ncbi:MAG: 16S rRNA (cytidine(1402)-2'-O)-methyltransferase [Chlorobiaceae bacterium]|nr:16S rRNA (cytidine(1402)-2'-O)-methyltransferase [Chlorobiaceae bacterium]
MRKLYLVSTPIGNYEDISLRAINILSSVNFIICEEFKEARRLLSNLKIEKTLFSLNEHNEKESSEELLQKILAGETAALISDGGTPVFSDPGNYLVNLCINNNVEVIPIAGANSLMLALIGSGFGLKNFYYSGWLSPKKEIRQKEMYKLKKKKELIILMETPYRLKALLSDVVKIFGGKTRCVIAFQLTMSDEKYYRGSAEELLKIAEEKKLKGEFVFIINNK